jgi:hypothetical protein
MRLVGAPGEEVVYYLGDLGVDSLV